MGGSHSREEEEESDYYGVRITHQLLDSLDGTRKIKEEPVKVELEEVEDEVETPLPRLPFYNPAPFLQQPSQPEPAPEPELDHFAHLRTYLINSEKVGELLLKVETEEFAKVQDRVTELASQSYVAPNRPPPCQSEHDACLECYTQNPADAQVCSASVAAYSACTQQSYQAIVQSVA